MTEAELSPTTVAVVKSTAPILREQGLAITTRMYQILFEEHPEVSLMFSVPDGEQEKRLAAAVLAYAENIDRIEELVPTVERIAAKHVASGVEAPHYDIVGDTLLRAMISVLGEMDMAVLDAWAEAYAYLANVFIGIEAELYASAPV